MPALPTPDVPDRTAREVLDRLGVTIPEGDDLQGRTPITGTAIGPRLATDTPAAVDAAVERATEAFRTWRTTPAPVRGQLVRALGEELRAHKDDLGTLVSLEAGKIRSEGLGVDQGMIDICDPVGGQSRQLGGRAPPCERPGHRMMETWQPLGPVGVISAFNFPVAVWSWNTAMALIAGDPVIWKPSEKTPLTALACQALLDRAAAAVGAPAHLGQVVLGDASVGRALVDHEGLPLISATGSTPMGRAVGERVAARFGRPLLERGGNNAAVVAPSADLDLVARAVVFSAAGTAGQRCTTFRRLIVHAEVPDEVAERAAAAFASLPIGDPLADGTLVGPLIDGAAHERVAKALATATGDGGTVVTGGDRVREDEAADAFYVRPALGAMAGQTDIVRTETFGPVLYALTYVDLDEAIALHNGVPQGLSSSIFTRDVREAERFVGPDGSDCGIANINIGPSGAEVGGAFGGEKETGGGRESGSDAWKAYMRRATTTVNYSDDLPLAQGVVFT